MCRTSGFLLLGPPPPSPSHLHGAFLFLPLQKATDAEWTVNGWQLLALAFPLTVILLQYNSLYLQFLVPAPSPVSFLILYYLSHSTPSPPPNYGSSQSFPFKCSLPSCPRLPALPLSSLSVRAEREDCAMQDTGSQIHPCSSCSRKMSRHFLRRKQRKLFLPLAGIKQQQQQQCGTVCRLQSGGQTERWIDRERGAVPCSPFTAGCVPQMLHHA